MNRIEFLNRLVEFYRYRKYLEIGVARGDCLGKVQAALKVGIDPDPLVQQLNIPDSLLFCATSDTFFAALNGRNFFDLVFIDGLHHHEQVHRDVVNALDSLGVGGTIVLHDCNPTSEEMQRVPRAQMEWTGDCWRAIVRLRTTRPDLQVSVLDTDYGLGVIRRGRSERLMLEKRWDEVTWNDLVARRSELLGLTPLSEVDRFFRHGP